MFASTLPPINFPTFEGARDFTRAKLELSVEYEIAVILHYFLITKILIILEYSKEIEIKRKREETKRGNVFIDTSSLSGAYEIRTRDLLRDRQAF